MSFKTFFFHSYAFDTETHTATFTYSFDRERYFYEEILFNAESVVEDETLLDAALFLAFMLAGISYYKAFPTREIIVEPRDLSEFEAEFFSTVYRHGLSQFLYENNLTPDSIARFKAGTYADVPVQYDGIGTLVLQSGGKDSLLLSELLTQRKEPFSCFYMTSASEGAYPSVLDRVGAPVRTIIRTIDHQGLKTLAGEGALNGHVPVTYITLAYALVDAILHGENTVLAAIGREGEEPHAFIGDFPVTHQWSKTWDAEQMLADYVRTVISPNLRVGSPLRGFSELRIAELFASVAWASYGLLFSSCNVANYKQGHVNDMLAWCGSCPKCANSFLLFAPFVAESELVKVFGSNLYEKPALTNIFKGLLGVDGVMKPFECVGEVDELRAAYHAAPASIAGALPFTVPASTFDHMRVTDAQKWASQMIQ